MKAPARNSQRAHLRFRFLGKHGLLSQAAVRWLKFNLVGGLGIVVQFAVLVLLKAVLHCNYLAATAAAVEAAVIHNFIWHERFTWADRVRESWPMSLRRLARFNATTGAVSIIGNLALMKVMVGLGNINFVLANAVAIAVCSILNFVVSEEWVFEEAAAASQAAPVTGCGLRRIW